MIYYLSIYIFSLNLQEEQAKMYRIGIDLGGTNIAVGIVNENHEIIRKGSVETKAFRDADEIVKDI